MRTIGWYVVHDTMVGKPSEKHLVSGTSNDDPVLVMMLPSPSMFPHARFSQRPALSWFSLLLAVHWSWSESAATWPPTVLLSDAPTVVTTNGTLSGLAEGGVAGFLGVPFAAPPTGTLRFQLPAAHAGWNGTRTATQSGSSCMQSTTTGSEDCLFINAFTPLAQLVHGATLQPVMFYIHGGAFVEGSAATAYNLSRLTGHVVFTTQYRLGVFGFFSTEAPPPNLGLADQRFALHWVRDNARAFGGDPDQIMIFGCSAGGASVAGMLTMPESYGLYSAAGLESPGARFLWARKGANYWELDVEWGCRGPCSLAG